MRMGLRRAAFLAVALALDPRGGGAEGFRLFPSTVPASHFFVDGGDDARFRFADPDRSSPWSAESRGSFRIGLGAPTGADAAQESFPVSPRARGDISTLWGSSPKAVTEGVIALASIYSMSGGWAHGFRSYHFTSEHFFGPDTYAGGADKCAHFIVSAALARELALLYDRQGLSSEQSTALAFGATALSGLLLEVGDGVSPYGFSWEDLSVDVLGSATGLLLTRRGLNDLIGLRIGKVTGIGESKATRSLGSGYSNEIYSADLKLFGLARRLRIEPGAARFLLVSVTYNTKDYGHEPPLPYRTRDVGLELGLNLPEILLALGLPEATWWGGFVLKSLNFFRVPFTSFGFRYDLNHHHWMGPDTGNRLR